MINWIATNTTGCYCLSKKSHVSHHNLYYSMCSKCLPPAPAQTQARRRWATRQQRPTHCWYVVSVRRRPRSWYDRLVPEAHSTRCSQWVEVRWVRRPESGWDKIGRLLIQQCYCLWRDVMGHCPAEKRKTRFQMLHECQEATSVSKRRHDNTPHWFWLLVRLRGRECYWHRAWTLLRRPPRTYWNLTWFLADESHWCFSF